MNLELLRLVDGIARDKNIDPDSIFVDLEAAMASAARKHFAVTEEDVSVTIDRQTGEISASLHGEPINIKDLGRIPAQTAKQVMIQKIREDERGSIYSEYRERVGELVSGTVGRFEGGATIVSIGRAEAILPRDQQIPGESHHSGERVRAVIKDVKETTSQVKITLSRTNPTLIRRLFEQEVPEVTEHIIEIKALARKAGYRSKVAVTSIDNKVDAVGACVGVRGSRIKNIVDELGGEKIDIVRWNESSQILIGNALRPAEVQEIALCFELNRATVVVDEDQLSLAIGKKGLNVYLAARLTGWDIEILTPQEYNRNIEDLIKVLRSINTVDDTLIDKIMALGVVSVLDIEEIGAEPLVESLELPSELATEMVSIAAAEARRILAEKQNETLAAKALLDDDKARLRAAAEAGGVTPAEAPAVPEAAVEAGGANDAAETAADEDAESAAAPEADGESGSVEADSSSDDANEQGVSETEQESPEKEQ